MPKKVLIITYYWPPAGGIAVQRWVKFSKYLNEYGWEPIIYTVSNGDYPLIDISKLKDVSESTLVIKQPIWEPYQLYRLLFSPKKNKQDGRLDIKSKERATLFQKISIWFRGNFFVPDARMFWIKPSIKFLSNYLSRHKVDAIISTGPPHSTHLIALGVKKKLKVPWLADFRDPWTNIDYYRDLMLTQWVDKKHHLLEKEVIQQADAVSVVGAAMQKEFELKRGKSVEIVTNGFDTADFEVGEVKLDSDFSIVHIGSLYERRNPVSLWQAVSELKKENHACVSSLKIKMIGKVDSALINSARKFGIEKELEIINHLPHKEAIQRMLSAPILLLPIDNFEGAQWVLTGKLFEYLAAHRPILCIGPVNGDAANVITETKSGSTFGFDDVAGIKNYLIQKHQQFVKNELYLNESLAPIYSHQHLAQQVATILNSIISNVLNLRKSS